MLEIASKDWDRLILNLYSAGLDSRGWAAFLGELTRIGGYAAVAMIGHDFATNANLGYITHNYDESFEHSYRSYYAALNPWMPRLAKAPVGKVQTAQNVLPHDELVRTEFHRDWLNPQEDISAGVGITLYKAADRIIRINCNIRQRDMERVQPRMFELMERLAPHLVQALAMTRHLAGIPVGERYTSALELAPSAALLLDSRGRVRHANRLAMALSRSKHFFRLGRNGQLIFEDRQADAELSARLSALASGQTTDIAGSFHIRSAMPGRVLLATVIPFVHPQNIADGTIASLLGGQPFALLCLGETAPAQTRINGFARAFNLTAAEQELAKALYAGHSLRMAADARSVSIHTARNQLKSIFSKTSVSRQNQLMALMVRHLERFEKGD